MDPALVLQTTVNAIVASSIYAMVSVGLAMAFGVMMMANYAHGELFMVGSYVAWLLYAVGHWPFPLAVVAAAVLVGAISLLVERGIFRPMRDEVVSGFIATAGLAFILQVAVGRIWGVGLSKPVPPAIAGSFELFGASVGWQRLLIIPAAVAMLVMLLVFLRRFKLGRALRAAAQDAEAANLQGISTTKMSALAMAIGGAFAGVAGALMAPVYPVTPYVGHSIILTAFIIVIVGGLGSIEGAILASILFGFLHTFLTTAFDGVVALMAGVMVMLIVLTIRPQGLMGRVKA